MTGFVNPTNRGRVEKLVEILGHLDKSRQSNKAPLVEWNEMLAPVHKLLVIPSDPQPEPDCPAPATPPRRVPVGIQLREWAATAPVADLLYVLAVALNRFDEALSEKGTPE
jgi:hypothetical protein